MRNVAMHIDMETDEFEQADFESCDDESDHGESHNWAGIIVILCYANKCTHGNTCFMSLLIC